MVAIFIMAIIGVVAGQAFHTAMTNGDATDDAVKRLAQVDRLWVMLENDFRNAIPKEIPAQFGKKLPAMYVNVDEDYWLTMVRGGFANPLFQPRTEMVRVGYRIEDETIWRDTWYDLRQNEQDQARTRRVLEQVNDIRVRLLRPKASSFTAGPWVEEWPQNNQGDTLPWAIEITLELEDFGEVMRLYSLLPGKPT